MNQDFDGIEGVDYVECPICGHRGLRIYKHLKLKHNLSLDEFAKIYPNKNTTAECLRNQIKNNTKVSLNKEDVVRKRKEFRNSPEGKKMASANGARAWKNKELVSKRNKSVSAKMKELWQDKDFKESQSLKIKEATNSDRVHKLHHDRLIAQWKNKEYRIHITECVNNQFDDERFGKLKDYIDLNGNKVKFRSSWELSVHNILLDLNIEHYYEYRKFKKWLPKEGKYLIYRTDFYLPLYDVYFEVKPDSMQQKDINLLKRQIVLDEGCKIFYIGDKEYKSETEIKKILNIP